MDEQKSADDLRAEMAALRQRIADIERAADSMRGTAGALRESEERLRLALEAAQLGWFDLNVQTGAVIVSPEYVRLIGYEPGEFRTSLQKWIDAIHPDDRAAVLAAYRDCLATGDTRTMEYRRLRRDNGWMWIRSAGKVVEYDAEGRPLRMTGTHADISERRRTEEGLRQSEERFRSIYDNIGIGVALISKDMEILSLNPQMRRWFPHIDDTASPRCYENFNQPPREAVCPYCPTILTLQDGQVHHAVTETPTGNETRHYRIIATPLLDPDGSVGAAIEMVEDMTQQVQNENALRRSEEFVRSILDSVDEGFLVLDRNFRIMTANRAYCAWTGGEREDIIGKPCYAVSHRRTSPCYEAGEACAVMGVFETGMPQVVVHRHTDADGRVNVIETKAFPLMDEAGSVISVIQTVRNISERHLLEQEQLKTQKLEAIGTLAGGIAHDFNNLLQGVFGYIAMAKLTIDRREKALAMLEQAEKALNASAGLTTQLLTFSKGGRPVKKKLQLAQVIENTVRFGLSGSKTDGRMSIAQDLWQVEADEGQISQVIQNIVLNATEAMPDGGIVRVTADNMTFTKGESAAVPNGGHYVKIEIRDSGIGIPAQHLPRIFDPYFTTKQKGSGLGLATAYSIMRNHGGVIEAVSEPEKGSAFVLMLPACDVQTDAGTERPGTGGRKGRILVMDDEEIVRSVASEMITALGHEVVCAVDGEKALELFIQSSEAGRPFDVVILDLTVRGGMGGEQAIARLLDRAPGLKAVVSSGYGDNPVVSDYRSYGFSAILNKPYRLDALKDTLAELLR